MTRGDEWVHAGHYSDARGTVAGVETSKGGKAVGVTTKEGTTTFAKSAKNNDMYATHDGNVYRNQGAGWQTYENGSWKPVEKPEPPPRTDAKTQPGAAAERGARTGASEWSNNAAQLERDREARQSAQQRRGGAGSRDTGGRSRGAPGAGRRK